MKDLDATVAAADYQGAKITQVVHLRNWKGISG